MAAFFAVHLLHAAVFARLYPDNLYDPDLLAYFVYFRNWLAHDTTLHGVAYFTHPKPLLVFVLGPLASVSLAFACSALASAALGSVVYLIGRDCFGRPAGMLFSLFLLLDPSKAVLTLKSSADLYVAVFLFLALYESVRRKLAAASAWLFLSALVKPVTLPCALYFLAVEPRRRSVWLWVLVPFLALPLTMLSNDVLLGSALGSDQFLKEFATLREGATVGPGEVLHFALWTQLVKNRFVSTAPWGFLGVLLWLAADRRRLTSPLLLVPLLFLGGYFLLSVESRYMPFFRFYWALEIWFLGFVIFGILEAARRLANGRAWVKSGVTCLLLFFLMDDYVLRQLSYRDTFALPFEESMAFVQSSRTVLEKGRTNGERILAPLAFLPYLLWELQSEGGATAIVTAESAVLHDPTVQPDWILDVPRIYASPAAREFVAQLVRGGGYEIRLTDGKAALLARTAGGRAPDQ